MDKKVTAVKTTQKRKTKSNKTPSAPNKLFALITVVNRKKEDYYIDLLQGFGVNASYSFVAKGTAPSELASSLGIYDSDKSVIISIIVEERLKSALDILESKFSSIRDGKGIAFTIPFSSIIGSTIYQFFLS